MRNFLSPPSFLKLLFFTFGFIFVLILVIELAFDLRDWREHLDLSQSSDGQTKSIILIGDSILGIGPGSAFARAIENHLQIVAPGKYRIKNLSVPGNSSERVFAEIDSDIESNYPQYAVILLGKSDHMPTALLPLKEPWYYRLKFIQLTRMAIHNAVIEIDQLRSLAISQQMTVDAISPPENLKEEISKWGSEFNLEKKRAQIDALTTTRPNSQIKKSNSYFLICFAYALKSHSDPAALPVAIECAHDMTLLSPPAWYLTHLKMEIGKTLFRLERTQEAERFFFEAMATDHQNPLPHLALAKLHLERGYDCEKAIPYFKSGLQLLKDEEKRSCLDLFLCFEKTKRYQEGENFFSEMQGRPGAHSCEKFAFKGLRADRLGVKSITPQIIVPKDREEYIAKLWYYQRKQEAEKANALFRNISRYPSEGLHILNKEIFQKILARLQNAGVKTLVLQYPNEPNGDLDVLTSQFGPNFHFLSLQAVISQSLETESLFSLLDSDGEHLTPHGAEICGFAAAQAILDFPSAP